MKHITWYVIFLRQLLHNNHNLILADGAQAMSCEAPASSIYTAFHYTLHITICYTHTHTLLLTSCMPQLQPFLALHLQQSFIFHAADAPE